MNADRISHEELVAYAAGELGPEDAGRIEAWLDANPEGRATVDRFHAVRRQVAADAADAPPAELVARAKAIFTVNTATPWKQWLEKLDTLVATLVFDSRLQPVAVRDEPSGDRFQLAYESDTADVDVQAQRKTPDSRWTVMGQLAADDGVGARRVSLFAAGSRECRGQTVTDDRGMFEMEIDSGAYDLSIEMPEQEVILPAIRME